jgi:hypothetical protein
MRRALLITMLTAAVAAPAAGAHQAPPDPVPTGSTAAQTAEPGATTPQDLRSPDTADLARTRGRLDPTAPGYNERVHAVPVRSTGPSAEPSHHAANDEGSDATTYILILAACGIAAGVAGGVAARRARRGHKLPVA